MEMFRVRLNILNADSILGIHLKFLEDVILCVGITGEFYFMVPVTQEEHSFFLLIQNFKEENDFKNWP